MFSFPFLFFSSVLDANPWRETSKPVYVLTQKENQLCTMKTRRNRRFVWLMIQFVLWFSLKRCLALSVLFVQHWNSEVERELGLLFSKGSKWSSGIGNQSKQARGGTNKFQMLVEDVREGVLVCVLFTFANMGLWLNFLFVPHVENIL